MEQVLLLYTKPQAERYAIQFLTSFHFKTYFPMLREQVVRAHRRVEVDSPLFSRYLFVWARDEDVPQLRRSPGISDFTRTSGTPVKIPMSVIEALRQREGKDGVIKVTTSRAAPSFVKGEVVRVVADGSPWQGLNAVFEKSSGEERASVFIDIFGRATRVQLGVQDIQKL